MSTYLAGTLLVTLLSAGVGAGAAPALPGYIAPVAGIALRPTRWPSYQGHAYAYELLILSLSGILQCYLVGNVSAHGPRTHAGPALLGQD